MRQHRRNWMCINKKPFLICTLKKNLALSISLKCSPMLNKYYHTNLSISGHYLLNEVSLCCSQHTSTMKKKKDSQKWPYILCPTFLLLLLLSSYLLDTLTESLFFQSYKEYTTKKRINIFWAFAYTRAYIVHYIILYSFVAHFNGFRLP